MGPQRGGHTGSPKFSGWHRCPQPWGSRAQPTVRDGEIGQPSNSEWARSGEPAGSVPQLLRPKDSFSVTIYR